MAAANGSTTTTEDARYPSHLTADWFSARRSSRSARRSSKRRTRLQDDAGGASDSSSGPAAGAAAPAADGASAAGLLSGPVAGPAGGPAGPAGSGSVTPAQLNALMTASVESDDGGLPLFSDSAAQRLEPAELPNPKYVSSLVQQIETRLTTGGSPLASSATALIGRHLERKNTPPSERGPRTARSLEIVPSTPQQGVEAASAKQPPVERIKVPQLASMLSWGSRSGASSPNNHSRFNTQSASAVDTAEMIRRVEGSAAMTGAQAGEEGVFMADRRRSTRSRSSTDARSEQSEVIASARAAAAEWRQQAEQRAEAARAWVDAAAGVRGKGPSPGPSSRSLSPMNSVGSPRTFSGPKRGVAAYAAQQSLEDKRRRQQQDGAAATPPSPFGAANDQMAAPSVEVLMDSMWSGGGSSPPAPMVDVDKAPQGAAEWRSISGVDVTTGGAVAGDASPPATIASSGRHDSSVVPELVAAYDQVSEHSEPLPPTFAARHRLATLAASFQTSGDRAMAAAAQRAVDAAGEADADEAPAPVEVDDREDSVQPSPTRSVDSKPTADVADGMLPATPAAAAVGLVTRTRTRGEAGWMSDDSEVSDGGDAFSPRAGFAVPSLGELALQQSAARVEEAYEALLEGRPIRSWSAPELVELEAIANGEQYVPAWDWGTETEEEDDDEGQGADGEVGIGGARGEGGLEAEGDGEQGGEGATDEQEPAGYLSDLGPRRSPWRRDSNSSGGDEPAWARMPLTPELRAAKAAREQALQRAPLITRSQAALYQMAANLRDGGRHRRKTLRELFADGRGGVAPAAAFPMDQIIRAGSESALLEARYQALMAKIRRTSSFERGDDISEDDTDENSGAGASDDEAVRRTTAGVSVQPAANRVGLHGEDEDGDADVEDADHRDLESSSDDDELDRASPFSTSDEEEDEDDAEDGADIAAVMPGSVPLTREDPGAPVVAAAAAAALFAGGAAAAGGFGKALGDGDAQPDLPRRHPAPPQRRALDPATPSPQAPRPSQRQRRLTVERMAASMSDDGADDAPQDGGRPAVMRWRSGRLLDRLNNEAEAHMDRMNELDGTYEGHGLEASGQALVGRTGSGSAAPMDPALREALAGRARAEAALAAAMVDEDEAEAEAEHPLHEAPWLLPPDLPSDPPSDGVSDSVPSEFPDSDASDALANGHHPADASALGPDAVWDSRNSVGAPYGAEHDSGSAHHAFYMPDMEDGGLMDPLAAAGTEMDPELDAGIGADPEEDGDGGFEAVARHLQLLDQLGLSPGLNGRTSLDIGQLGRGDDGSAAQMARLERSSRSFDGGRPAVPRLQLPSIPDEVAPAPSLVQPQAALTVAEEVPTAKQSSEPEPSDPEPSKLEPSKASEIQPTTMAAIAQPPAATVRTVPPLQQKGSETSPQRQRSEMEAPQQQTHTQPKQAPAAPAKKRGLFRRVFSSGKKDSQKAAAPAGRAVR